MAKYMVRVELYGAESDEYETLHERMKSLGLHKVIQGENNKVLQLPHGTYHGEFSISASDLCSKISVIASPLSKRKPSIIACALAGDWEARLPFA
jgi:hypothetical protein